MAQPKIRSSCDSCLSSKVKCDQTKPGCARCKQHGQQCVYSHYRKIGRPCLKATSKQGVSKQAESRVNSKPAQETRQSGPKVRRQHPRANNDQSQPQSSIQDSLSTTYDQSGFCLLPRNSSPLFPLYNINEVHTDSTQSFSPYLSASTMQSDLPDSSLISPVSWEPSLQVGSTGSDIEPMAIPNGNCLADLTSADWETLNRMLDLPEVDLQDLPAPFDPDQGINTATVMNELMSFPHSPPHSINSACATPAEVSFPSYTSPSVDFAFFDPPRYISEQKPLRLKTQQPQVQEPSPVDSLASSPTLYKPSTMAGLMPHQDSARWLLSVPESHDIGCTANCHLRLSTSISRMAAYLASNAALPLHVLLELEDHMRDERSKILECEHCMNRTQRGHTLFLVTTVAENSLRLFERDRTLEVLAASPPSLTVGAGESDLVLRAILSMSYRRQLGTVAQLETLLNGSHDGDATANFTRDQLAGMRKRCGLLMRKHDFAARAGIGL